MSHGYEMLGHVEEHAKRERVKRFLAGPFDKLGHGWANCYLFENVVRMVSPDSPLFVNDLNYSNNSPIDVRYFNSEDLSSVDRDKIIDHFWELGVPVSTTDFSNGELLILATVRPQHSRNGGIELKKDIEGAKLFYGYLMYRGFVSKSDVKEVASGYADVLEKDAEVLKKLEALKLEKNIKPDAPEDKDILPFVETPTDEIRRLIAEIGAQRGAGRVA